MKNLKLLRIQNNLTQEELAHKINKSSVAYGYYESGRNEPDIKSLITLADYFNCSIDYLLDHQTTELLHRDSFTADQQKAIDMIKKLDEKETVLLLGYLAKMTNTPLEEVLSNKTHIG